MSLLTSEFMARLDGLQVAMRKVLSGRYRGERRSRRRGRSVEFADHREYAYGDDIRFIDWHLVARLDRFFLKLYHDEEELRLHVLVDASKSMDFGAKFDHTRKVAAALAYVGLSGMNRVKVVLLREAGLAELPWLRGVQSAGRLFTFLEEAEPTGRNALVSGVRRYVSETRPSGVVLLLSDLMEREGPEAALRPLVRPMIDAHLVQILTPEEVEPDLDGDLRLIDSEERDSVDISATTDLIAAYRRNLASYLGAIEEYGRAHGMGYLLTTTDVPFEDLVLRHLRERGVLT